MTRNAQLDTQERIEECKRIVAGAPGYTSIERAHAALMLRTLYKERR